MLQAGYIGDLDVKQPCNGTINTLIYKIKSGILPEYLYSKLSLVSEKSAAKKQRQFSSTLLHKGV